jgi:hypothetical protein
VPVFGHEIDLPGGGIDVCDHQGQGRLGEFEDGRTVGVDGSRQFAGELRLTGGEPPDGLSVVELPSGLPQIGGGDGRVGAAACQEGQGGAYRHGEQAWQAVLDTRGD